METCKFCMFEFKSINCCPRCKSNFCSIRCYRSTNHQCSEQFYKECIEKEMQGTSSKGHNKNIMPFEEYMEHTADVEMPENVCDADVENNLDSDDEDLGYLQKVMQETKDQFGKMSMGEIDSTLTANGINCLGNEEEMMNGLQEQLTDEERKAFSTLFDTYQQEVAGLGQSCFSKRV